MKHDTQLKSVRRTTEDLPMGQRRYPECVAREGKPRLRSLEDVVALPRRSPLTADLQCALAAASRLHGLRSDLSPVPVVPTATISEAGAYRFRQRDPIDLRVSRVGGRSALGFLHELGHLLDHQIFYDRKTRSWASAVHQAFAPWRDAAAQLEKRILPGGYSRQRYFQSVHEVWARSYAQTVLLRSEDQRAPPTPREAAGRRRRAHLVRGPVRAGGDRGRARLRAARAQAAEPAARRVAVRRPSGPRAGVAPPACH